MVAINRFGTEGFDFGDCEEDDSVAEFKNDVDALLARTDRQLAAACADVEDDEKIRSIVGQHFQGRDLSSKQRWRLAAYCVNHCKSVES